MRLFTECKIGIGTFLKETDPEKLLTNHYISSLTISKQRYFL